MYSSSLSTAKYNLIRRYLPVIKITKPRKYNEYQLLNGILYVLNYVIKWREIPTDFPQWIICYLYFRKLSIGRYFDVVNKLLANKASAHISIPLKHILIIRWIV